MVKFSGKTLKLVEVSFADRLGEFEFFPRDRERLVDQLRNPLLLFRVVHLAITLIENEKQVVIGGKTFVDSGEVAFLKGVDHFVVFLAEIVAEKNVVLNFELAASFMGRNENLRPFVGGDGAVEIELVGKGVGNHHLLSPVREFLIGAQRGKSAF